jgi:hypothetical protein
MRTPHNQPIIENVWEKTIDNPLNELLIYYRHVFARLSTIYVEINSDNLTVSAESLAGLFIECLLHSNQPFPSLRTRVPANPNVISTFPTSKPHKEIHLHLA